MQLHFSVDGETGARLAKEARKRGMSLSSYIASLVVQASPGAWPSGYLERVVGSCASAGLEVPPDPAPEVREGLGR